MYLVRAHLYISGRVQGVFFRYETCRLAKKLGVTGWVKNLSDDRVEAVFEGENETVQRLIRFCHHGPSAAKVTNVEIRYEPPKGGSQNFIIL